MAAKSIRIDDKVPKYTQNWPAYNKAQMQEPKLFPGILHGLCTFVPKDKHGRGRPRAQLPDMTYSCGMKLYERRDARKLTAYLDSAREKGHLEHTPKPSTIWKYFNDPRLVPVLRNLIQLSATPLRGLETTFAVDATGFSSAFYSRWLDYPLNGDKIILDWRKGHFVCGTKTNIITNMITTDGKAADSPQFPQLVNETANIFKLEEVCADKGYSSRENLQLVWDKGGIPWIPFKSNTRPRVLGGDAWSIMFNEFQNNPEKYMKHYHQRSNVESTISSLKRKFREKLMFKNEIAQTVEILAQVLDYNICVLIMEMHVTGLTVDFPAAELAYLFPFLHINSKNPVNL